MVKLVNKVKFFVAAVRQEYREDLPGIIAKEFGRKLTKTELGHMHLGLGRTDVAALGKVYKGREIRKILTDRHFRAAQIKAAEEGIYADDQHRAKMRIQKADQLAEFMVTRKPGQNLLRNATAVAWLFGETGQLKDGNPPSDKVIGHIDRLTTLYALEKLDPAVLGTLETLAVVKRSCRRRPRR